MFPSPRGRGVRGEGLAGAQPPTLPSPTGEGENSFGFFKRRDYRDEVVGEACGVLSQQFFNAFKFFNAESDPRGVAS